MFKTDLKINFVRILSGIVIALGVILLVMAIGAKVASQNKPADPNNVPVPSVPPNSNIFAEGEKNNSISYAVDPGNGKKIYDGIFLLEEIDQNVFSVLKTLAEVEKAFDLKYSNDSRYGIFVESIGGIKNGDSGKYWQYYLNGTLGDVAADKKAVKAGDKVEWRFEKVPEF